MEDAREYLLRIPSFAREKHSLSQAEAFLRELDCPLPGVVIHVAGTNGKGSVCAFLSSILRASGLHVGTFTSPHLTDIRERMRVNVSQSLLLGYFAGQMKRIMEEVF